MARPRQHSDDELLTMIGAGLHTAAWTLTEAAEAAEVHPATLIKRFGSRLGVLEALSRRWVAGLPTQPSAEGGLRELRAWLHDNAPRAGEPAQAVHGLGMLFEDLQHDHLSALLREGWTRQRRTLAALVAGATSSGELTRAPAPDLAAELLLLLVHGAQVQAAAERGSLEPSAACPWPALLQEWA